MTRDEDLERDHASPGGDATQGFPERLASVIGERSVRAFARSAGVSDTFLRQCLAGRTEPTRTKLIAIARAGDTTVEWLATGQGRRGGATGAASARHAAPDRELLEAIIEVTESVLAESGRSLSPAKKAHLVSALYEMRQGAEPAGFSRDAILKLVSSTA